MDERLIRALLTVINHDSEKPKDAEWCAEIVTLTDVSKDRGVRASVRFWLVSEDSEFINDSTLVWGH